MTNQEGLPQEAFSLQEKMQDLDEERLEGVTGAGCCGNLAQTVKGFFKKPSKKGVRPQDLHLGPMYTHVPTIDSPASGDTVYGSGSGSPVHLQSSPETAGSGSNQGDVVVK
jgi:hypothetical protein